MRTLTYILTVTTTASQNYAGELVTEGVSALADMVTYEPGEKVTLAHSDGTVIKHWES